MNEALLVGPYEMTNLVIDPRQTHAISQDQRLQLLNQLAEILVSL